MKFTTAAACEQVVWQMRLADWPRAQNRAKLNDLYNGLPPYTPQEEEQNRFTTNVNFLDGTKILHDARRQFSTAFTSSPQYLNIDVDYGPVWKRKEWATIITNAMNRVMKKSRRFLNCLDSQFASVVLHGIGPVMWEDRYGWCPYDMGMEDVLIPSNTLASMRNLPFIAIFRQYTGYELWKKTSGPKVDPGWNMDLVRRAIAWVDEQAKSLMSTQWPEVWSPEKMSERIKQDGGLYASDAVPTIDTFDVYFWNDEGKKSGWCRRIILDAWGSPGVGGAGGISYGATPIAPDTQETPKESYLKTRNEYLYDGKDRIYAESLDELIHFQFADASCVAPFRYHSVRGLGFLLYSVCHLQNRLRCRFNDSVFENMLQYFRVANPADAQRLTKVDLLNYGVIPDGLSFVKSDERWQVPEASAGMAMEQNRRSMADNSASFTQDYDFDQEKAQETATRTMAKVNASAAMIGAMLNKAYNQQGFQYKEIARRFCIENSRDPEVRKFRVECLKRGVPEKVMQSECWDIQPVRVVGSGNKTLQVAMADKLMAIRGLLDPEGQKLVERVFILANSDDPSLSELLVPDRPHVSDSMHDAQALLGTLMQGLPVSIEDGMNHSEYIEVWLHGMATIIKQIEMTGGMATPQQLQGLNNVAMHIEQHLQLLSQDPSAKEQVRTYQKDLGQLTNLMKGYAQRLQEQMQRAGQGQNGQDPKEAAKAQSMVIQASTKAKLAEQSHAQRTAQRQIQFEQQLKQDQEKHAADLAQRELQMAADARANRMKSFNE